MSKECWTPIRSPRGEEGAEKPRGYQEVKGRRVARAPSRSEGDTSEGAMTSGPPSVTIKLSSQDSRPARRATNSSQGVDHSENELVTRRAPINQEGAKAPT